MSEHTPDDAPRAVLHLVDRDSPPAACATVRLLIDRLDATQYRQQVLALGNGPHTGWLTRHGISFEQVRLPRMAEPIRSLHLGRWLAGRLRHAGGDSPTGRAARCLIHAHSPRAAGCATVAGTSRAAVRGAGLAVEVYRQPSDRQLRWLGRCRRHFDLKLTVRTESLGRLARAAGLDADSVEVLRPGLEAGRVRATDRERIRGALGLAGGDGPVLLAGGWCHGQDHQKMVLWAAAILSMLYPRLKTVVPGQGPLSETLFRWISQPGFGHVAVMAGERFDWPELVTVADLLVYAGGGRGSRPHEADTTPIAWAMTAGLPVVAADAPGTAELIRDHHNGLLCRLVRPRELAMQIRLMLTDASLRGRLAEAARREAARLFDPADTVAGYQRLYRQMGREQAIPATTR